MNPISRQTGTANGELRMQYRPAIDGLRAIAVLAVCVFHLNRNWLPGGFTGVDVFFVISGYLITGILLRDLGSGQFSFARFYQRRIARLFPAFFTVAIATIAGLLYVYSDQDIASAGANLAAAALSVVNIKLMVQGNYFTLSPDAQPLLHYWSLSVEEQFYLFFPLSLKILYQKAEQQIRFVLIAAALISYAACAAVTAYKPEFAFYLLPTRAWELLTGSLIAAMSGRPAIVAGPGRDWIPAIGLLLVAVSLGWIPEGPGFPGYIAALPVLGTAFILISPQSSGGTVERRLSWPPLVAIGRMSYSLYLWHWPIFSLVDYGLCFQSDGLRTSVKVVATAALATIGFRLVESPGRDYLNDPRRRRQALAFLAFAVLSCAGIGVAVRQTYYVNASPGDVADGGLAFNSTGAKGAMVLMGDSNGSMYGRAAKSLAVDADLRLNVISAAAGDPLPHLSGTPSHLWTASLETVKRIRPDFLVLSCNWQERNREEPERVRAALGELARHARFVILLTQPPTLPKSASRAGIRSGERPPYFEATAQREDRRRINEAIKQLVGSRVAVIDVEPIFVNSDGSVRSLSVRGEELYQDAGHLSGAGAEEVKPYILSAMTELRNR